MIRSPQRVGAWMAPRRLTSVMSSSGRSLLPAKVGVLLSAPSARLCRRRCCSSTPRSKQTAGNASGLTRCSQPITALPAHAFPLTLSSPEGGAGCSPRPSSSADIWNGGVSTSPSLLPSCSPSLFSLSPLESPLAVGSFLEQRAWQLFRPTNQSEPEDTEEDGEQHPETPPLAQEAEEAEESLLLRSPSPELQSGATAPPADALHAGLLRRRELTIMDYDETVVTPEL